MAWADLTLPFAITTATGRWIGIATEKPDEIWIPLGVSHTDHHLTHNACLLALAQDGFPLGERPVRLYPEVPYVVRAPEDAAAVVGALERAGAEMTREVVPVASALGEKLHLVSLYASQFKAEAMRPEIETSARQGDGAEGMPEVLWRVTWLPKVVEPFAFYPDQQGLRRVRERLRPCSCLTKNGSARRGGCRPCCSGAIRRSCQRWSS